MKSRVNMTLQWRWVMKVPRENAVSAVDAGVPTGVTRMSITQFRRWSWTFSNQCKNLGKCDYDPTSFLLKTGKTRWPSERGSFVWKSLAQGILQSPLYDLVSPVARHVVGVRGVVDYVRTSSVCGFKGIVTRGEYLNNFGSLLEQRFLHQYVCARGDGHWMQQIMPFLRSSQVSGGVKHFHACTMYNVQFSIHVPHLQNLCVWPALVPSDT